MQDRVNQQWLDMVALLWRQMGLNAAERKAGWTESFTPAQLAVLQRPYTYGDMPGKSLAGALLQGINAAVASGALASITKTEQVVTDHKEKFEGLDYSDPFVRRNVYGEREFKPKYSSIPVYGDKEFTHITAPAFAAWLAAQRDNTPSPHIQAWFDAVGVAAAIEHYTNEADSVRWTALLEAHQPIAALVPSLRAALHAVPEIERDKVELRLEPMRLLVAHVLALWPDDKATLCDDGSPAYLDRPMTDSEAQEMGAFWYQVAAGEWLVP